jgi:hypothetical protein
MGSARRLPLIVLYGARLTLCIKAGEIVMSRTRMVCLAIAVWMAVAANRAGSDEPTRVTQRDNKLLGTWKLVSPKLPEGYVQVKHVTPVGFMWATYDKDGEVVAALGGSYTLKGENYEEVPEYGLSGDLLTALRGKTQSFKWKIEGNKWHHTGKLSTGQRIAEVWQRVEQE